MLGLPNNLDKTMKTLANRLRYAMEVLPPKKVKGVELARAVGVKPPSVSDWLSGKSKTMEGENLLKVAKYLGISPIWLATGKGEHEFSIQNESPIKDEENECLKNTRNLSCKIENLITKGKLTNDQIKIIDGMINGINATINSWLKTKSNDDIQKTT